MIHPARLDLNRPFEYISALYSTTEHAVGPGGGVTAQPDGIRVTTGNTSGDDFIVHRIHRIYPASDQRIMIATWVQLSTDTNIAFLFGFMDDQATDPFDTNPVRCAMFYKASGGTSLVGRSRKDNMGNVHDLTTERSVATTTFLGLAVILHGEGSVEYLWTRTSSDDPDQSWNSVVEDDSAFIPTDGMQPAFAVRTASSGSKWAEFRSMYLESET